VLRISSLLLALFATIVPVHAFAATNPASPELTDLVGTWTCSYKGPSGSQTITTTASRLDEDWVELNRGTGGDTLVTYDAKRKQWVQFRTGAEGNYALLIAEDPPDAAVLHWKMVYPDQTSVGTTSIRKSSESTRVVTSTFTKSGKLLSTTAVCTKSRG
jgi:hypothetical protein